MRIFYCDKCQHRVFFDNVQCTSCGSTLAYLPDQQTIGVLLAKADGTYTTLSGDRPYRLCQNAIDHAVCTWAVPVEEGQIYCRACRLNQTIPDLSQPQAKEAWASLERAKRWLLCNLFSLGLPIPEQLSPHGLRFSFKADNPGEQVFTGQSDGLITINIAEASDPFREKIRQQLGETYRTLLGHFRHEIGHYYWDLLIKDSPRLEGYRALFGDERQSYDTLRDRHYREGAPNDWPARFVSAYASMHSWEDWAETWAHYLHIADTLETARQHALVVEERSEKDRPSRVQAAAVDFSDFEALRSAWVPFTIALNSLNRSMGLSDAYPFVLSEKAIEKLHYVHEVIQEVRAAARPNAAPAQPVAAPAPTPKPTAQMQAQPA